MDDAVQPLKRGGDTLLALHAHAQADDHVARHEGMGNLMRTHYNPLFDYIKQRIEEWISTDLSKPTGKP